VTGESSYDAQSGFKSAAAACPAGKTVIGGGGRVERVTGPALRISAPADPNSWIATGYSGGGGAWQVTAIAICAVAG
jgi:hypothetical protein